MSAIDAADSQPFATSKVSAVHPFFSPSNNPQPPARRTYPPAVPRQLRDMTVLITGASAGIGAALARQLHAHGARLVLSARREDRLHQLNRELGGQHLVVPADVALPDHCARLIDVAFNAFPRLDTLVLNAGYGDMRPVAETEPHHLQAIFATNLLGTLEPIRLALPRLLAQPPRDPPSDPTRAQLMIVSSAAARRGLPYFGAYSATKAAQLSIAEALRVEIRGRGIPVTTVHPVGTATEFFDVAQARGNRKMPPRVPGDIQQSADQVAAAMVRAIRKPGNHGGEVWPFKPARFALSLATLLPGFTDRIMAKARGHIETAQSTTPQT